MKATGTVGLVPLGPDSSWRRSPRDIYFVGHALGSRRQRSSKIRTQQRRKAEGSARLRQELSRSNRRVSAHHEPLVLRHQVPDRRIGNLIALHVSQGDRDSSAGRVNRPTSRVQIVSAVVAVLRSRPGIAFIREEAGQTVDALPRDKSVAIEGRHTDRSVGAGRRQPVQLHYRTGIR